MTVKFLELGEQRYSTCGYWTENDQGHVEFWITKTEDWRYMVCVLAHELTEWAWCKSKNVTTAQADDFDALYEEFYRSGKVAIDEDPGDDPSCPYYGGHQWGNIVERITACVLGVDWEEYCKYFDTLYPACGPLGGK